VVVAADVGAAIKPASRAPAQRVGANRFMADLVCGKIATPELASCARSGLFADCGGLAPVLGLGGTECAPSAKATGRSW
jgi:hypothetical protein